MRHGKKFNHLSRKTAHRKSMLANMACSLIEHKRINTTEAKAKALRQYVEPLITKSKNDTTHNRRIVFSSLRNKYAVSELFRDVAVKVGDRPGGYVRIIKLGNRQGDNAAMAMVELVDYNELLLTDKEAKKSKSTRRRRGSKKSTTDQATAPATEVKEVKDVKEAKAKAEAKAEPKIEEKAEEKLVEAKKEVEVVKKEKAEEVKEDKTEEKTASVETKEEEPKEEEKKEDTEEKKA